MLYNLDGKGPWRHSILTAEPARDEAAPEAHPAPRPPAKPALPALRALVLAVRAALGRRSPG